LVVDDVIVGYAGELSPRACDEAGLPRRTCAMELNLDVVIAHAQGVVTARGLSTFPVAKEDVALVVDASVPAQDVQNALAAGAGPLLESVRLFDVYSGDQVQAGKKSLAFALRFRAPDRTLNVDEVTAARTAAVEAAQTTFGAVLRS
jgi:phenylalanyl-tRNA synthetase beta chain